MNNKKVNKPDPFQLIIENRKIITETIQESQSVPNAWELLKKRVPELTELIKLNTFKGYVKTLNVIDKIMDENDEIRQEKEDIKVTLGKVRQEKEKLEIELGKVRHNLNANLQKLLKLEESNEAFEEKLGKVRQEGENLKIELGKVRQESNANLQKKDKIEKEKECLEKKLYEVSQKVSNPKKEIPNFLSNPKKKSNYTIVPNRVDGWGVQLRGDYYRLFKKIDGKVKWIHVGKKWDIDLAKRKIKDFLG